MVGVVRMARLMVKLRQLRKSMMMLMVRVWLMVILKMIARNTCLYVRVLYYTNSPATLSPVACYTNSIVACNFRVKLFQIWGAPWSSNFPGGFVGNIIL